MSTIYFPHEDIDDLKWEFRNEIRKPKWCRECGGYGDSHEWNCPNAIDVDEPEIEDEDDAGSD